MNQSAILHIPLSQYAFSSSETILTIRIRTGRGDLDKVTLFYGDRACKTSPVVFYPLDMRVTAYDETFDYYEVSFESPFTRVCYYFLLEDKSEWYYYYADEFTKKLPDLILDGKLIEGRSEYYQYPFLLRSEVLDVPKWFKEAVVYNIFPDSFASKKQYLSQVPFEVKREDGTICKSRLGGTIRGIYENLDYIQEMGFNCIYLNPIFVAGESHKYDILDYYHIDPCFGTEEEFAKLVQELHHRKMHIIIDGVFNHCSWYFFAFEDVIQNQESSQYKDWFYHLNYPVKRPLSESELPCYDCFAYERKMPKLNTANVQVQDYFEKVCRYWIRKFHIDGWRLDVANEIDRNFWRRFRKAAKEEKSDIVLIGEVWENSETWLRGDAFDSTMNYDFRKHCREFFGLGTIDAMEFQGRIQQMQLRYPKNIALGQLNLLDSHDVPRFLSICNNEKVRYQLALLFLFLTPGVPSLFYGDELGITGILEQEYRRAMPWDNQEHSLREFITQVIRVRKSYNLQACDFTFTTEEKGYLLTFMISGVEKRLTVSLNCSEYSYNYVVPKDATILMKHHYQEQRINCFGFLIYEQDLE